MKLNKVPTRLKSVTGRQLSTMNTSERRVTGSRLQDRRKRIWLESPECAKCGRIVTYPSGFELDHIVPLALGGSDTESNWQILCVQYTVIDGQRVKLGCHADKTLEESTQY